MVKEMSTHSGILAWEILWTEEPGELQSGPSHKSWTRLKRLSTQNAHIKWTEVVTQLVKNQPAMQETQVQSLVWEDPLEKEMATHSSILAWKISWTEESGGLQSMGSQRVRHN